MEKDFNGKPQFYKLRADFTVAIQTTKYILIGIVLGLGLLGLFGLMLLLLLGIVGRKIERRKNVASFVALYKCNSNAPFPPLSGWERIGGGQLPVSTLGGQLPAPTLVFL